MEQTIYQIDAFWDADAAVWVATSEDVLGLATEADTIEALSQKLRDMIVGKTITFPPQES